MEGIRWCIGRWQDVVPGDWGEVLSEFQIFVGALVVLFLLGLGKWGMGGSPEGNSNIRLCIGRWQDVVPGVWGEVLREIQIFVGVLVVFLLFGHGKLLARYHLRGMEGSPAVRWCIGPAEVIGKMSLMGNGGKF